MSRYICCLLVCAASLSLYAQSYPKSFQKYFEVNSELSLACDSLYYASAKHNVNLIEKFYVKTEAIGLESASTNDSMGYYLSRGLCEYLTDKLDASVASLLEAESLAKVHKDLQFRGISGNHIGNAYYLLKDNKTALEYYNRVALNDSALPSARSSVFNNISVVNMEYYQASSDTEFQDSLAKVIDMNFARALKLQRATKDYSNMAGTYSVMIPWFQKIGRKDSALHYVDLCRKLSEKHGFIGRIAFLQIKEASLLIDEGRFAEAGDTAAQAVKYYKDQNNADQTIHALAFQAKAYDSLGDYKRSKEIMEEMYRLMNTSFTQKRAEAVSESETKYKTKEKELENQKLISLNNEKQLRLNRLFLAIISLLAVLLAGFLFYRNRLKKKELELKSQEVEFKNMMIKSNMESEEEERRRIARELHDGVGQQISSIKLGLENIDQNQIKTERTILELKEMVSDVLHSVRGISHQMMPVALERLGFIKAVEELVDFQNEQGATHLTFENFNVDRLELSETKEIHLYRIVQEL
ncbi:MAG: sensor histidine kinase, partial [Bacteroidia bacterium]